MRRSIVRMCDCAMILMIAPYAVVCVDVLVLYINYVKNRNHFHLNTLIQRNFKHKMLLVFPRVLVARLYVWE